jgi:hypothetical protein
MMIRARLRSRTLRPRLRKNRNVDLRSALSSTDPERTRAPKFASVTVAFCIAPSRTESPLLPANPALGTLKNYPRSLCTIVSPEEIRFSGPRSQVQVPPIVKASKFEPRSGKFPPQGHAFHEQMAPGRAAPFGMAQAKLDRRSISLAQPSSRRPMRNRSSVRSVNDQAMMTRLERNPAGACRWWLRNHHSRRVPSPKPPKGKVRASRFGL